MKLVDLPHDKVRPNPEQPRKLFDKAKLAELAASIDANGLQQPIRVRHRGSSVYEIVCGERRWRAFGLLGRETIPCLVEQMSDEERDDAAIVENLNRADITPMEEARAFQRRLDSGISVEELARRLGVMAFRIRWRVALLRLLPEYLEAFEKGMLDQNQANCLAVLGPAYQPVLFAAIRDGRVKGASQMRALTAKLEGSEKGGEPVRLLDRAEQVSMFQDPTTPEDRERLTAFERKLAACVEMVAEGFDENEVVVVRKVRRGNAHQTAEQLRLLEVHVRKLRLALEKDSATSTVAA